MAGTPPIEPRQCEECGRQEMRWEVSIADTSREQVSDTDTNDQRASLTALFGKKKETTTKTTNAESSKSSNTRTKSFYLCSSPTCDEHLSGISKIIYWKLENDSTREYSDKEFGEIIDQRMKQTEHDHQIITDVVEEVYDTFDVDSPRSERSTDGSVKTTLVAAETNTNGEPTHNTESLVANDSMQQIPRCEECGQQEAPETISTTDISAEQKSDTDVNRTTYLMAASLSVVPFLEVGGETETSDETTELNKSSFRTSDTATFSICPEMACKEHLTTRGLIQCWELRSDSTREYSDEEIDKIVEESLKQEIQGHQIVESVSDEFFNNTSENSSKQETSKDNKKGKQPQEKTADGHTRSEKQAEGKTGKDEETEQTEQYDNNGDRYLDRYISTGDQTDSKNKDNSKDKGGPV